MNCSKCQSERIIKYGHTHYGKQRFQCLDCGRQFVENQTRQPIDEATRNLIDKLLHRTFCFGCDCTSNRGIRTMVADVRQEPFGISCITTMPHYAPDHYYSGLP